MSWELKYIRPSQHASNNFNFSETVHIGLLVSVICALFTNEEMYNENTSDENIKS